MIIKVDDTIHFYLHMMVEIPIGITDDDMMSLFLIGGGCTNLFFKTIDLVNLREEVTPNELI